MKKLSLILAAILAVPGGAAAITCSSTDSLCVRTPGSSPKAKVDQNGKVETDGELELPEMAAPSTPASGRGAVYFKTDGKLYIKDDAGTESDLTGGAGHTVSTGPETGPWEDFPARDNLNFDDDYFVLIDSPTGNGTHVTLPTGTGETTNKVWQQVDDVSFSAATNWEFTGLDPAYKYRMRWNYKQGSPAGIGQLTFNGVGGTAYDFAIDGVDETGATFTEVGQNQAYCNLSFTTVLNGYNKGVMEFEVKSDDDQQVHGHHSVVYDDAGSRAEEGHGACRASLGGDLSSIKVTVSAANFTGTASLEKLAPAEVRTAAISVPASSKTVLVADYTLQTTFETVTNSSITLISNGGDIMCDTRFTMGTDGLLLMRWMMDGTRLGSIGSNDQGAYCAFFEEQGTRKGRSCPITIEGAAAGSHTFHLDAKSDSIGTDLLHNSYEPMAIECWERRNVAGTGDVASNGDNTMTGANTFNGTVGGTAFGWNDWTPSFTGFSVDPGIEQARYFQLGKLVIASYEVSSGGTSNATTFTLTLPVAAKYGGALVPGSAICVDNGATITATVPRLDLSASSTTMSLYKDAAAGVWTASGTKYCNFTITYEAE